MTQVVDDAPPLEGMSRAYGMWVTSVGEDGGLLVAGHQSVRRAIAAMNWYSRHVIGLKGITDGDGNTVAEIAECIEQRWARRMTLDDCDERTTDLTNGRDHRGCEMCDELSQEGGWWLEFTAADQPGAFPVTWMYPY